MMLHVCLLVTALALALAGSAAAQERLVSLPAPEGISLFERASEKAGFWPLMATFVSQNTQSYCGIASSVMALNALGVSPPPAPLWYPYPHWDQTNIFTLAVLQVKAANSVEAEGLTVAELARVLVASGARAKPVFAGDTDLAAFRAAARQVLANPAAVLLVNYFRATLGQGEGGHISPAAAYNAEADSFLLLDVARYKYKPTWIPADLLFAAMNTVDPSSHKTRGYVVVRK
ncbi:phytochelatin synthase family protein [Aquabacter spiritensis]|uniref:glutathione gamma-glutamylcysteinyltransferase n=1 Tax=Aquabacter spiritensis TaxID=933073 RepID=A0A4R3LRE3_9HYPH|nr:phytochelatin synthase family protein [Aquabacter spiritensis]TCT03154.1 phytochelatin synthase [Aquabacter spiritensis]